MAAPLFPTEDELEEILVGPGSVTWQRASDSRLYFVMLYPLLLQVAHPSVGAGVHDYSDFEARPWKRLLTTLDYVTLLVYGGRDAVAAGQRLRALHKRFRGVREDGKRYHALEPASYAWVHATLLQSYIAGHAHFGTPMSETETECFYREYRRLGRLIGVRETDLPPDWSGFRDYFDHMVERELTPTEAVQQVLRAVRRPARPPVPVPELVWRGLRIPAARALWLGGIGLMDGSLRSRLGIPWNGADEAQFRALGRLCRGLTPIMPERMRITGPRQLRWRRPAIMRGPLGTGAERAYVAEPDQGPRRSV